ncbi:phosphoadenosine phosphosulfate reductase, partial [Enterococcus faecalis]
DCVNEDNYLSKYGWDFFINDMQFETFIVAFAKWYQKKHNKPVMCGVGIRTNESFNRFRTIVSLRKEKWEDYSWTTLIQNSLNLPIYNFYPIYDWQTRDIWIA